MTQQASVSLFKSIGSFGLVRLAGVGAFSNVYEASHPDINEDLALKVLQGKYCDDPDMVNSFYFEAQCLESFDHESLPSFHGAGFCDRRHWIAMDFLEGYRLDRIPYMDLDSKVSIIEKVSLGIDYVHSKGILHRDIKPGNVLISANNGKACIFDFGLAVDVDDLYRFYPKGMGIGTPHFMAPEAAKGEDFSVRSEVYSLGCLAYNVFTGRPPFNNRSPIIVFNKQLSEISLPMRSVTSRPDFIPKNLDDVVLKSLQKDPDKRQQSAREFAEDLLVCRLSL